MTRQQREHARRLDTDRVAVMLQTTNENLGKLHQEQSDRIDALTKRIEALETSLR